jgi:carnosine N-methyltransferase
MMKLPDESSQTSSEEVESNDLRHESDHEDCCNHSHKENMFEQSTQFCKRINDDNNYPNQSESKLLDDPEEYNHLKDVCAAFFNYHVDSLRDLAKMERDLHSIPERHKSMIISNYLSRIERLKFAINQNRLFLLKIIAPYTHMFKFYKNEKNEVMLEPLKVSMKDIVKMRSTLKLFIRDWSKEGKSERENTYTPILEEFKEYFPENKTRNGERVNVLLPGVGLGRLLYEFSKLGYRAQGNEFSYFMLLSSNFILNCTSTSDEFEIQPLIHSFSNIFWEDAPFKTFKIPDENLYEELSKNPEGEMSMVAGEFVEVYKNQKDSWFSVVTCFFIDTAHNIIEYIETIHSILKIDGLWINFGPLLYHYSEMEKECSIELSWEELKVIIKNIGFEIRKEEIREAVYSSEVDSMFKTVYRCIFFTAVKVK